MNSLRTLVASIALVLLGGGYLASQLAASNGNHAAFAFQMDQPSIRILAALVLVGAVVLSFAPDREEN